MKFIKIETDLTNYIKSYNKSGMICNQYSSLECNKRKKVYMCQN